MVRHLMSLECRLQFKPAATEPQSTATTSTTIVESKKRVFAKRCPFCSTVSESRQQLVDHLAAVHADNLLVGSIDVDTLPDETTSGDDSLSSTTEDLIGKINALTQSPLDLRLGSQFPWLDSAGGGGVTTAPTIATSTTTTKTRSDSADASVTITTAAAVSSPAPSDDTTTRGDAHDDFGFNTNFDLRALSTSPSALLNALGSPLGAALAATATLPAGVRVVGGHSQRSLPLASSTNGGGGGGSGTSSKRYRTHLTPLQVFVMKSLFTGWHLMNVHRSMVVDSRLQNTVDE